MIIDVIFFCFYALPFLFFAAAIRASDGKFLRINPLTFLLFFYFVRNHVGLPALYFGSFQFKDYDYSNVDTLLYMAIMNTCVFVIFFLFSKLPLYVRWANYISSLEAPDLKVRSIGYLTLVALVGVVYMLAILRILDNSPLFMLIETTSNASAEALKSRLTGYGEGSRVFGIRLQYLNMIYTAAEIIMVAFAITAFKFKRKTNFLISIILFIGILLWYTANTSKGYIVVLFIYYYIALCFFGAGQLRFLSRPVALLFLGAALVSSVLAYFVMGHLHLNIFYPLERFVIGNLRPQYVLMDSFDITSMLLGQSAPTWYSMNNHSQFLLAEYSWRVMHGSMNASLFYHNPSSFVAELHANFSVFSLLFLPVVFCYVLILSLFLISNSGRYAFIIAVYCTYYFSKYSVREIIPVIFDYRLVLTVFAALVVLRLITRRA